MSFLFLFSVFYLLQVHRGLPIDQEKRRMAAQQRGISVEQFRNEELIELNRCFLPYTRFFGRRYLEKECRRLTYWRQHMDETTASDGVIGKE